MEKDRASHKWTFDETNLFWEILADPVNNFMETLERGMLKSIQQWDPIIGKFKEGLENAEKEKKRKKL